MLRTGAVILAGGASRRMGEDKAILDWGGVRAVDRVARLATALGAEPLVVAGGDYGWPFVLDPHPHAGPCAGVAAGADALRVAGCSRMTVLAVDAPTITRAEIEALLQPAEGAAYRGFPVPFVAALDALPVQIPSDMPLRRLVEQLKLVQIEPSEATVNNLRGANTPAERATLLALHLAPPQKAPGC